MVMERGWERSGKSANQLGMNFYGMTTMDFKDILGNKQEPIL